MKSIFCGVLFLLSLSARADGVLAMGPNTSLEGVPRILVSVTSMTSTQADMMASCQSQFTAARTSLIEGGFTILATIPCYANAAYQVFGQIQFQRL